MSIRKTIAAGAIAAVLAWFSTLAVLLLGLRGPTVRGRTPSSPISPDRELTRRTESSTASDSADSFGSSSSDSSPNEPGGHPHTHDTGTEALGRQPAPEATKREDIESPNKCVRVSGEGPSSETPASTKHLEDTRVVELSKKDHVQRAVLVIFALGVALFVLCLAGSGALLLLRTELSATLASDVLLVLLVVIAINGFGRRKMNASEIWLTRWVSPTTVVIILLGLFSNILISATHSSLTQSTSTQTGPSDDPLTVGMLQIGWAIVCLALMFGLCVVGTICVRRLRFVSHDPES